MLIVASAVIALFCLANWIQTVVFIVTGDIDGRAKAELMLLSAFPMLGFIVFGSICYFLLRSARKKRKR